MEGASTFPKENCINVTEVVLEVLVKGEIVFVGGITEAELLTIHIYISIILFSRQFYNLQNLFAVFLRLLIMVSRVKRKIGGYLRFTKECGHSGYTFITTSANGTSRRFYARTFYGTTSTLTLFSALSYGRSGLFVSTSNGKRL